MLCRRACWSLSSGAVIEVIPGKAPHEGKFHVTATYNKKQASEYSHVLITHSTATDAGHYLEVLAHKLGALKTGDLHLVEIIRD